MNGEKAERKPDGGQRERDRESDQHGDYQAAEHQRRHHLQRNHCVGLSYFASIVTSPRSAAMRLITSETPCSASMHEAGRDHELDGPANQPAGIAGHFTDRIGLHEERPGEIGEQQAGRDQEEQRADHVEPELAALGEIQIEDLDPDVLVALEGVGGAEHHQDRKHVPLQFEPAIGAVVECVADHGVGRADDDGGEHQKIADVSDLLVDGVDRGAQCQQWTHHASPGGHQTSLGTFADVKLIPLRIQQRSQRQTSPKPRFDRLRSPVESCGLCA